MAQVAGGSTNPQLTNIRAIVELERESRRERTFVELLTDHVAGAASSPGFLAFHLVWFLGWIAFNLTAAHPFDPFPFSLLTLAVALEAIVLTAFVLMAQGRMTQTADKRAHLDLQVNLLAEQELTAILKLVRLLAQHQGLDVFDSVPELNQLLNETSVKTLSDNLAEELADLDAREQPSANSHADAVNATTHG